MHPAVLAQDAAVGVDDLADAGRRAGPQRLDDPRIVAIRDETDLLALGLLRSPEAECPRAIADLALRERPDREACALELGRAEIEQEVRLILGGIGAAVQRPFSGLRVVFDAGIVPCRHGLRAKGARPLE